MSVAPSTVGLYATTNSKFFLRNSDDTGVANTTLTYQPTTGDTVVAISGDWSGDGTATIGLYDQTNGTFYLRNTNNPSDTTTTPTTIAIPSGLTGSSWIPVVGAWNGAGDEVGLYNQTTAMVELYENGAWATPFMYGPVVATGNGLQPIAGKWTSGATDATIGLYSPTTSLVYLRNTNTTGISDTTFWFGSPTDQTGADQLGGRGR